MRLYGYEGGVKLVATEDITRVYLIFDIGEALVKTICDDGMAHLLELGKVVDNKTAEEGLAIGKGGLVDDDFGTLSLDAFHDALDS